MTSIKSFLRHHQFGTEATEIMSAAFDEACTVLKIDPRSVLLKQPVADSIVRTALAGIIDKDTLVRNAIAACGSREERRA